MSYPCGRRSPRFAGCGERSDDDREEASPLVRTWWTTTSRRVRAWVAIVAVTTVVLPAAILLGAVSPDSAGPRPAAKSTYTLGRPPERLPSESDDGSGTAADVLPVTSDPDAFAAAVAEFVLGMDPARRAPRTYRDALSDALDRDVLGDDYDRLRSATLAWIPDDVTWRRQADLEQLASFRTKDVVEPDRAIFSGDAPQGHEVRTINGLQEIGYLAEDGSRASHTQARALSVWMFCPPGDVCGLVAIPGEVLR